MLFVWNDRGELTGVVIMLVIALCYAEMAGMFPVSGGEVAYTYKSRLDSPLFGRVILRRNVGNGSMIWVFPSFDQRPGEKGWNRRWMEC